MNTHFPDQLTILDSIVARHIGSYLDTTQHTVAEDGILSVGEGYLRNFGPRVIKHVRSSSPGLQHTGGNPRGVVLLSTTKPETE